MKRWTNCTNASWQCRTSVQLLCVESFCITPVFYVLHTYARLHFCTASGMEKGFHDYQTFSEGGVVTEESLPVYMIAKKKLEQYLPFEEELVRR